MITLQIQILPTCSPFKVPVWFDEEDPSLLQDILEIAHDAEVKTNLQHFKHAGQLNAGLYVVK